jgi:TPR repeat protein
MRPAAGLALLLCLLSAPPLQAQDASGLDALQQRAASGDRGAIRRLAESYALGRDGLPQDYARAAAWYRKLAAQGDAQAQTTLGLYYARGYGVAKDPAKARRWWSLAAAQNDAGAQHNLGMSYLEGEGVAADPGRALYWLRHAAARGHVLAQRILGLMYLEGRGTARDEVQGAMWLTVAAERGEEGAQQSLKLLGPRLGAATLDEANKRAAEWLAKFKPRS